MLLAFDKKPCLDLLSACGQMQLSNFMEVFSKFCEPKSIVKIGEGTYGEAFRAGPRVCKIVPIDGDFTVKGEIHKVFFLHHFFMLSMMVQDYNF
ncbi:hypothetical protein Bca4012_043818 [Brassica carinata]|uniref:Protein kinase domain-containing protein n=3 Tax=Brassica TaxID=3705 RepID=A0A3P6EAB5_BRAOL|nr:unnamed protein product [Brassica napus]CDY40852.1 BnaC09g26130D [Brassica napus]VDD31075.1 unnamed protein product [Brassica oleracea]